MMQFQAPDYSFIANAGRAVGSAIEKYPEALAADKLAKANNIDNNTFDNKIWPAQIEAMQKKATDAGIDQMTALSMSVKYAPKRFKTESVSAAAGRMATAETLFNKALEDKKREVFQKKMSGTAVPAPAQETSATNQQIPAIEGQRAPSPTSGPLAPVSMKPVFTPEAARSRRLEGSSIPTGMISGGEYPGDAPQGSELPPVPASAGVAPVSVPSGKMSYAESKALAENMGIQSDPAVAAQLKEKANQDLANENWPDGTTADQVFQKALSYGMPTEDAKTYANMFQTRQQQATNTRLSASEEQRNKLRQVLAAMRERRLAAHDLKSDDLKLLNTQINAVQAQIDASENKTKLALGLSTGKDVMGGNTYDTGEKWQKQYEDAETTFQSANALLERIGRLNDKINPDPNPPKPLPPAKSKFKIVNVR